MLATDVQDLPDAFERRLQNYRRCRPVFIATHERHIGRSKISAMIIATVSGMVALLFSAVQAPRQSQIAGPASRSGPRTDPASIRAKSSS